MAGRTARGIVLLLAALAGTAAAAGPAYAHVSVSPAQAAPGTTTTLTFRVPNERADATTVGLRLVLPASTPIDSAAVHELAGWRAVVERTQPGGGGPVSAVTWTALTPDAAIDGEQFQEFRVSLGPLPDGGDRVVFKALQTYSDGQVARWIEEPETGKPEPENPAVVLRLDRDAGGAVDEHGMPIAGGSAARASATPASVSLAVGVAALVLAAAALLVALVNRAAASTGRR
ncbi:YcnI family protein [Micromonospora sp. WMMD975]|uniref:YcnI family protein n=1 Tax=Micromonospora sp. WMMD975 TaxID=3016087 RepID=UPI00249AB3FF|nr:YcnI family protein [Micromonospora sp. WMMD975]WFE30943.1 YcnI family protein [Micromonospora sp. WMMD975]